MPDDPASTVKARESLSGSASPGKRPQAPGMGSSVSPWARTFNSRRTGQDFPDPPECAVEVMGATNSLLSTTSFPMPSIDVGDKNPVSHVYNFIVGYSEPMVTQGLTVLATLDLFYLDTAPLALMLGESNPSSLDEGYPAILLPDGSVRSVWIENCACVNQDCCDIETEETSFGTVKSLFR